MKKNNSMQPSTTDKELQFMPVRANKQPIHKQWEQTRTEYDFSNAEAVGLVCGKLSGGVSAIDLDLKYDLTGKLYENYKRAIQDLCPGLLAKLVVQKTMNGGYHFIYKCDVVYGNKKLASRGTTDNERYISYQKAYDHKMNELKTSDLNTEKRTEQAVLFAIKARDSDKVRVMLETRGEKGYIACWPTPGYELVYRDFSSIERITPEEQEVLFNVAYSFNEYLKESSHDKKLPKKETKGLTPSEDFNDRGDVVGLLCSHGWTEVGRRGNKILMRRPGDTKADSSGNYDTEKRWFSVFSTSTEFEAQTPYKPYAVYCMLKCGGDFTRVTKMLAEDGYGDPLDVIADSKIVVPSIIDMTNDDMSFLATESDYNEYLDRWRKGTFEKGKSTGMSDLDRHFLFKEGNLVIVNGIDNVGKSTVIWYLANLASVLHGWRWLIFSSENKVGGVVRKLIEFYWDKQIDKLTDSEFFEAKAFVKEHFDIIKTSDRLFNYQDILNMASKAMSKKKYHGLMIDPYNSLKVDVPAKNKQSTYEYHYEAASVIQLFGRNNNLSIYLNCHVGTSGAKNKDKNGYTMAPQKEDTEMGVMFANKADEFLTIHRVTQHATDYVFTEIHVRKVKETETGGRVTPYSKPIYLRGTSGVTGFHCLSQKLFVDAQGHLVGQNPIREWQKEKFGNPQSSFFEERNRYADVILNTDVLPDVPF